MPYPAFVSSISMRPTMVLFSVSPGRLMEGAGKDARKRLLRFKAVAQADFVHALVRFTQIPRRQQQLALADVAPQTFAFVLHKQPL